MIWRQRRTPSQIEKNILAPIAFNHDAWYSQARRTALNIVGNLDLKLYLSSRVRFDNVLEQCARHLFLPSVFNLRIVGRIVVWATFWVRYRRRTLLHFFVRTHYYTSASFARYDNFWLLLSCWLLLLIRGGRRLRPGITAFFAFSRKYSILVMWVKRNNFFSNEANLTKSSYRERILSCYIHAKFGACWCHSSREKWLGKWPDRKSRSWPR